jgi:hypothetical protein
MVRFFNVERVSLAANKRTAEKKEKTSGIEILLLVMGRKKTSEGETTYNIVFQPITGYRVFRLAYFYIIMTISKYTGKSCRF